MNRLIIHSVVYMSVCVIADSVMAQAPWVGPPRSILFITTNEQVQAELKLTEDQKAQLQTMREQAAAQRDTIPPPFSEAERLKRMDDQNAKVLAILSEGQQKRAKELVLQYRFHRGMSLSLTEADLVKEFEITEKQRASLQVLVVFQRRRLVALMQSSTPGPETQAKYAEIVEEGASQAKALLTADQLAAIEKAQGAKFEFPPNPEGGIVPSNAGKDKN